MNRVEWWLQPKKEGYAQAWDDAYQRIRDKEYDEYMHSARFPAELVPEYEPRWFWTKVYPIIYSIRQTIWYSKIVHTMWDGYKVHTLDWVWDVSPRGYRIKIQVPTRTPIRLQKLLRFVAKHSARCWGIGHFLEAIAIGNVWGWDCTHCGYKGSEDLYYNPWFKFTAGGSRFTGEYTQHWFEGFFDCPRCLHRWEYEDSD